MIGGPALATAPRPANDEPRSGNALLRSLPDELRQAIEPHLVPITAAQGSVVQPVGSPVRRLVFPDAGVISLTHRPSGKSAEVALIGNEGMLGLELVLGMSVAAFQGTTLLPVRGWRLDAEVFTSLLRRMPALHLHLLEYAQAAVVGLADELVRAKQAKIPRRLAAWLLAVGERVPRGQFAITHRQIAQSLDVRRSGITSALHDLQQRRIVRSGRNHIEILDMRALRQQAHAGSALPCERPHAKPHATGEQPAATA